MTDPITSLLWMRVAEEPLWFVAAKLGVFLGIWLNAPAGLVWAERRVAGWVQDRKGPNRVWPFGIGQPVADVVKLFFKEDVIPDHVDKGLYLLGPCLFVMPALILFAVIPLAPAVQVHGWTYSFAIADLNIGVLFFLAVASLELYGLLLGAWASRSKFSLLGALRSSAQMISYEIPMGLAVVVVILHAGSPTMSAIIASQTNSVWNLAREPVAFLLFYIAILAENNRLPFDLAEAEQELIGGYHIEYSSMKFGMFFMAEYLNMLTLSAMAVALFLGGWGLPFIAPWVASLGPYLSTAVFAGIFLAKTAGVCFVTIWARWTLPRLRYDQLMSLGWKRLLPLGVANVFITAAILLLLGGGGT